VPAGRDGAGDLHDVGGGAGLSGVTGLWVAAAVVVAAVHPGNGGGLGRTQPTGGSFAAVLGGDGGGAGSGGLHVLHAVPSARGAERPGVPVPAVVAVADDGAGDDEVGAGMATAAEEWRCRGG